MKHVNELAEKALDHEIGCPCVSCEAYRSGHAAGYEEGRRDASKECAEMSKGIVCLGGGFVMMQDSDVILGENGPQVQIDFFEHEKSHKIGELSTAEEVAKKDDFRHLCCIGSNKVESLDVLIGVITDARNKLEATLKERTK